MLGRPTTFKGNRYHWQDIPKPVHTQRELIPCVQCQSISYLCVCEIKNSGSTRLNDTYNIFLGYQVKSHRQIRTEESSEKLMVIMTAFRNNNKPGMNIPAETNNVRDRPV